jgi:hypothetical protein
MRLNQDTAVHFQAVSSTAAAAAVGVCLEDEPKQPSCCVHQLLTCPLRPVPTAKLREVCS